MPGTVVNGKTMQQKYSLKKSNTNVTDYNLLVEIPYDPSQKPKQDYVLKVIKNFFSSYNVNKIEIDDGIKLLIVLEISSDEIEKISEFESAIKSEYNNSKISYFENRILT